MSITLTYPIRETHENLALKRSKQSLRITRLQTLLSPLRMMKRAEAAHENELRLAVPSCHGSMIIS